MTSTPPPGYDPSAGGSWGYSLPDPDGPNDRLSPLLLRIAVGLTVLLVAVVGYAWFIDKGGNSLNPIAKAAEQTRAYPGAKVDYSAMFTVQSQSFSMQGHGAFNGQTGRSRLTITAQMPAPVGTMQMEVVGDESGPRSRVYMRAPLFAQELPPGDEWIGMESFVANSSPETAAGGNGDPRQVLDQLRATSDVEKLGSEEVRGVETTRYRATVDSGRLADQLREEGGEEAAQAYEAMTELISPPTFEVWIDAKGLVRRLTMVMDMPALEGQPSAGSMTMQMDFHDFGAKPRIPLPNPDKVFDATELAREQLDL